MTTILIIEDNELNLDMLRRRLVRKGFDVIGATGAREGLRAAKQDAPDLILMDIGLPGIDGLEATRRLKSDVETCRIPVIALTAHATSYDKDAALKAGCCDFHSKPIDLDRLLEKIGGALGQAPSV